MAALVRYYVEQRRPKTDAELDWFRTQPSLAAAINHAALALDDRGKRFRHQTRISKDALEAARAALLKGQHELAVCDSFAAIHQTLASLVRGIHGLGPLYCYDTSIRIAAYLRLMPEEVFLHAGTLAGAKNLLGRKPKGPVLSRDELPAEFEPLLAREIEDFLCIFKGKFGDRAIPQEKG